MKLAVITSGSRGDVQPFLALAIGLKKAGHDVRLVTHPQFQDLIESYDILFRPLAGDPKELLKTPEGQMFVTARGPIQFLRGCLRLLSAAQDMLRDQLKDSLEAGKGMDGIVYSFGAPLVFLAAEKTRQPAICVALAPLTRTKSFSTVLLKGRNFGNFLNYSSHRVFEFIVEFLLLRTINRLRTDQLGLPKDRFGALFARHYQRRVPIISAFSREVVKQPDDWPTWHPITGYWILPDLNKFRPSSDLEAFLADGPPPIYVGFGSMVDKESVRLTKMVNEAADRSGQRVILSKGWSDYGDGSYSKNIYLANDIPHEWLFQQVAAVVHHGGAGTTAAALRAGVPSLIVPFGVDQPFWGLRIETLRVGLRSIPRSKLNVEVLTDAFLRLTSDGALRATAAAIGKKLRLESGVDTAIGFIEEYIQSKEKEGASAR